MQEAAWAIPRPVLPGSIETVAEPLTVSLPRVCVSSGCPSPNAVRPIGARPARAQTVSLMAQQRL